MTSLSAIKSAVLSLAIGVCALSTGPALAQQGLVAPAVVGTPSPVAAELGARQKAAKKPTTKRTASHKATKKAAGKSMSKSGKMTKPAKSVKGTKSGSKSSSISASRSATKSVKPAKSMKSAHSGSFTMAPRSSAGVASTRRVAGASGRSTTMTKRNPRTLSDKHHGAGTVRT